MHILFFLRTTTGDYTSEGYQEVLPIKIWSTGTQMQTFDLRILTFSTSGQLNAVFWWSW